MQETDGAREGTRRALRWVSAFVLGLPALSGCLFWEPDCQDPMPPALATPWIDGAYLATDPQQAWDTLVLIDPTEATGNWSLTPAAQEGWGLQWQNLNGSGAGGLHLLRLTPGQGKALAQVKAWSEVEVEDVCSSGRGRSLSWDLEAPEAGDAAQAGQGVHVMTAGFYLNGTLFYTNIPEIDQDPAWPKVDWYAWEGDAPLPVYVYEEDRAEEPAYWHGTTAGTALGEPTQNATLWDYFTTIPGFNEALKGLSTNTVRVALLSPEQAYTRAGNEDHPLYGAPLVFYIKVLDVVDLPCPVGVPTWTCGPRSLLPGA